jgi:hypothetical protein
MERGEAPGKKGEEQQKFSGLSTEQKTEMARRAEESIEDGDADPSQNLARSMGGCQLGDPTINGSSHGSSSLQEGENSDTDNDMEGIQPRGVNSLNEDAGNNLRTPPGTPQRAKASNGSQFSLVTPSPGKRTNPILLQAQGGFSEGSFNVVSPSPKKRSAIQQASSLTISPQTFLQRAQVHQDLLYNHADEIRKAASSINRIFPPKERQKTDPLLTAARKVEMATEILKTIAESPQPSVSLIEETEQTSLEDQVLPIKFKLGVIALQQAIEDVNTTAEGLVSDERGTSVQEQLTLLKKYQEEAGSKTALQNAFDEVASSSLNTLSFPTASAKAEFRQQKVEEAQGLLQQGERLMVTTRDEQSPVDLALSIFEECQNCEDLKTLNDAVSEVDQSLLLVEAAQKHLGLNLDEEEYDFALLALKTANEGAFQAMNQLKQALRSATKHQESWPLDVQTILEKVNS